MPNFWTITTQKVKNFIIKIGEAFSGPRTKDIEFDQKMEEMKIVEKSILKLNSILQNYASSTSGIHSFCREFSNSIRTIYDKNSSFGALGKDICDCHSQIEKAHEDLRVMINEIVMSTSEWKTMFNAAKVFRHLIQVRC
jgi:DNA repair ATPase RecN